jgi:membrane protease YdiL (CAAX protease family)
VRRPIPVLIEFLLKRYGHRWALRVVALLFAVLVPPCLPFIKSRLPPSQVVRHRKVNWAFM